MNILILSVILFHVGYAAVASKDDDIFKINVTMNGYKTSQEDQYAYIGYKLPDEELSIVGYTPLINMNSAHHMLTYACENPGSEEAFWEHGGSCGYGQNMIIHGWARDAPPLNLPDDVAFAVGKNTPFKYIVVNIHYLSVLSNDYSGNQLIISRKPRKYHAGVMLGGTNDIYLQPQSHSLRTPFSCKYDGPPIRIFAARVHAHKWARVNSLYCVRDGKIAQIVKGDPQWPQSFYPLPAPFEVRAGDYLVGQCVYDNNENRVIQVGSTHSDEMCNVYAMYSYEPFDTYQKPIVAPFQNCWNNQYNKFASLIPTDAEVPPQKPGGIGQTSSENHGHTEHTMSSSKDKDRILFDDDSSYEDYADDLEDLPYFNKENEQSNLNRILSSLGLPDYEFVDAQSYDHLLPHHLTYGKEQFVKLHYTKISSFNAYNFVENWPNLKSLKAPIGQIGGIALTRDGAELVVFHRGSRIWEMKYFTDNYRFRNEVYGPIEENVFVHIDTQTGQPKSQWGAKMFYLPHGLTIDDEGNFWVTDVAMHQVFKFQPTDLTHPELTVGKMFQAGSGPNHFCRPADIAVMKNGDFFVADGYCNNRIVKFNRKGEYITEWGVPMSGRVDTNGFPLPNEWNVVHSVTLSENAQLICGADRENDRIQCFNLTSGEFQREIRIEPKQNSGSFYAISFVPNSNGTILFAVTGGLSTTRKVYMIDAENGEILTSFGSNPSLTSPHDIAVSANAREVYVGELSATADSFLHKFELNSRKDLPTETYTRTMYSNDKNFQISLWIMIAFAVPVILSVLIGSIIRMKNRRETRTMDTLIINNTTDNAHRSSIFDVCFKRKDGFQRLEQYSDDENENINNETDDESKNFENETITLPGESSIEFSKSKSNNVSS